MKSISWNFYLLCLGFIVVIFPKDAFGQEICNNGIDDDADGLNDLNDPECDCPPYVPTFLIPNPSFEYMNCCPSGNAQLLCAIEWTAASAPTTDYVSTCGNYLGNDHIPASVPLPIVDGIAAVGFRNGQVNGGPQYKEYVATCLRDTMKIGMTYKIEFHIGFQNDVAGSNEIDIAIFASTECNDIPFGGDQYIGCPISTGKFTQLDETRVKGNNEWVSSSFEFTANKGYTSIVVGPNCEESAVFSQDPYFFLDNLILTQLTEIAVPFQNISGSICANNLRIAYPYKPNNSYQWYQDGIALVGEDTNEIGLNRDKNTKGNYVLQVSTPEFCFLSDVYELRIPPYIENDTVVLCDGNSYNVGNEVFTSEGKHMVILEADDGCDSILLLSLFYGESTSSELNIIVCEGDTLKLDDRSFNKAGTYFLNLPNAVGCDSLITLKIEESLISEKIEIDNVFEVAHGQSLVIVPEYLDLSITSITWKDEQSEIIGQGQMLSNFLSLGNEQISVTIMDEFGCEFTEYLSIVVNEEKVQVFIPNVFSPNDDGANDFLTIFPSLAVTEIKMLSIYDRFGNEMANVTSIKSTSRFDVWDGYSQGQQAVAGVYTYSMVVIFIDGSEKRVFGEFALIR